MPGRSWGWRMLLWEGPGRLEQGGVCPLLLHLRVMGEHLPWETALCGVVGPQVWCGGDHTQVPGFLEVPQLEVLGDGDVPELGDRVSPSVGQ